MNKCDLKNAKISEIFDSIQGEGPYIGYRQIFIRFCGCNLLCDYCDTEFDKGSVYTVSQLIEKVKTYDLGAIHSLSLTGGEPLLHYEFLKEFLPAIAPDLKKYDVKVYLETNGTIPKALGRVVEFVDIISMDLKVDSSAKIGDLYSSHEEFLAVSKEAKKEVFGKLVFDENLRDFEINECVKLVSEFEIPLVLQPKMNGNAIGISSEKIMEFFNIFTKLYPDTRLIGQVHKFFDIR